MFFKTYYDMSQLQFQSSKVDNLAIHSCMSHRHTRAGREEERNVKCDEKKAGGEGALTRRAICEHVALALRSGREELN